jgi:hypothetical protein
MVRKSSGFIERGRPMVDESKAWEEVARVWGRAMRAEPEDRARLVDEALRYEAHIRKVIALDKAGVYQPVRRGEWFRLKRSHVAVGLWCLFILLCLYGFSVALRSCGS